MSAMLSGVTSMDGALLLISAVSECPQPQTAEHLAAVEIMQMKNLIVLQNKIDLVTAPAAALQYEQIQAFVRGTIAEKAPIVPISAQLRVNMDVVGGTCASRARKRLAHFPLSPRKIYYRLLEQP
jgi:translation initiation factor 2 subunit 3